MTRVGDSDGFAIYDDAELLGQFSELQDDGTLDAASADRRRQLRRLYLADRNQPAERLPGVTGGLAESRPVAPRSALRSRGGARRARCLPASPPWAIAVQPWHASAEQRELRPGSEYRATCDAWP
jgi:hypothetical protein